MRLKLDENLPVALAETLRHLSHDVDTTQDEGLTGHFDSYIWNAAQVAQRMLITQDLDFSDLRLYEPGKHHGLMLVRLRNPSRKRLAERVAQIFTMPEAVSWARCIVVVTDRKIRVRRPSTT